MSDDLDRQQTKQSGIIQVDPPGVMTPQRLARTTPPPRPDRRSPEISRSTSMTIPHYELAPGLIHKVISLEDLAGDEWPSIRLALSAKLTLGFAKSLRPKTLSGAGTACTGSRGD